MPSLNPLLESDAIECAHKGKIVAFSSNKLLEIDGSCALTKQDLLNAKIIGCTHQIAGFLKPCQAITIIPESALSTMLEIEGDKVILAQRITQIFTDNGAPLQFAKGAEPKAKDIFELDEEINDSQNSQNSNGKSTNESSDDSNVDSNESNADSSEILTPLPQRYASNDDMAIRDLVRWQKW